MDTIFDSRNSYYKSPFGAVEEETDVHFRIVLPRYLHCTEAYLKIQNSSGREEVLSMFWCGMNGYDNETWECDYLADQSGVFWYSFAINTIEGQKNIFKTPKLSTGNFFWGEMWQLTVYQKNYTTPDWLMGGTIYQIFPDRFCCSGDNKKIKDGFSDRVIVSDWNECPQWKPNEKGEVANNDYFCGDLKGILQKLDYIKSLGVTCIYLNPIFEAHSNHRYNTADYSKIDPQLGTEEDFKMLCSEADKKGIKVILDGVFSHTGSDSIYFNKNNRYNSVGAYNSENSAYKDWYHFINWPHSYHSWWGFNTLPELEKCNPAYNEFINGENGIVKKWLKLGAKGWRLDVADELPDVFIDNLRVAIKSQDKDAVIIGEVWEDATNKESYGVKRRYLLGEQLDSVMNYPFRNAIISFLKFCSTTSEFCNDILTVVENYPKQALDILMNNVGTHDTERLITILAGEDSCGRGREWQSCTKMSQEEYAKGIELVKLASAMQYTLPGVPCLYYGDETGLEGYKDPFNRRTYPWGKENKKLISWYRKLGEIRKTNDSFKDGMLKFEYVTEDLISYTRGGDIFCIFNRGDMPEPFHMPDYFKKHKVLLGNYETSDQNEYVINPKQVIIIKQVKGE